MKITSKGFTLVELMVTVAVGVILLTLAVPGFQDMIRNNRMATQTNEFVTALNLARSEAVKRGVRVTVCKSSNGDDCDTSASGWEQGWMVFADGDNDGVCTQSGSTCNEEIISIHAPLAPSATLAGNALVDDYISFVPSGFSQTTGGGLQVGTVTLCAASKARQIILSSTGRVRIAEATCP